VGPIAEWSITESALLFYLIYFIIYVDMPNKILMRNWDTIKCMRLTRDVWDLAYYVNKRKQESLANAKLSARQQCVYDGLWRRNLRQNVTT